MPRQTQFPGWPWCRRRWLERSIVSLPALRPGFLHLRPHPHRPAMPGHTRSAMESALVFAGGNALADKNK